MRAKSIKGKSPEEIQAALQESMADGFTPTLATVFMSIRQDRKHVCSVFDAYGITIYGATTWGEFIDEEIGEGSIAILLMEIDPAHFYVEFEELNGRDDRRIAHGMAEKACATFGQPAFLLACSNLETDAELLVRGIQDAAGAGVSVFGGMAGDDFAFTDQFVFTNGKESNRAVVSVVLEEEKIAINGMAISGWQPVGVEMTVTKSEGGWVYEVDNKPVLDVVARYLGLTNVEERNERSMVLEMGVNHPFLLEREAGDFILRGGLIVDWENKALRCSGNVPEGSKFRFSLPADFNVIDRVIDGYQRLKETEMPEADAMIMYSCGGRRMIFGPLMSKEIEGVKNVWNVPMAGFFCNGEIGRTKGGNLEHHAGTTICAVLKEK